MLSVNLSRCRHCTGVNVLAQYTEDDIEDGGIRDRPPGYSDFRRWMRNRGAGAYWLRLVGDLA